MNIINHSTEDIYCLLQLENVKHKVSFVTHEGNPVGIRNGCFL